MQDYEIRIDKEGTWYYHDNKMFRLELVAFLASHLQKIDGEYYICWQDQKVPVAVEDVPFVINGVFFDGTQLKGRLADGREVILPAGTEVVLQGDIPYVSLFGGECDTRFTRAAYWQLLPYIVEENGRHWLCYPA